jgi:alpha-L-rhamnosidase
VSRLQPACSQGGSQGAYVLAIAFHLLTAEQAAQAATHLVAAIEARQWHLSTGMVCTGLLMLVLDKCATRSARLHVCVWEHASHTWGVH